MSHARKMSILQKKMRFIFSRRGGILKELINDRQKIKWRNNPQSPAVLWYSGRENNDPNVWVH